MSIPSQLMWLGENLTHSLRTFLGLGLGLTVALAAGNAVAPAAQADEGTERGGGNAVVCFDRKAIPTEIRNAQGALRGRVRDRHLEHITSIETYDLYDAREERGLHSVAPEIIPVKSGQSPDQYVEEIARRFENSVPAIADLIRTGAQSFPDANIVMQARGLEKVDDINPVGRIDTVHCVFATVAVQYRTGDARFLHIDKRLFNHPLHTAISKAVLLLHEYVYLKAREHTQNDSADTRSLVSHLITRNSGVTVSQFINSAQNMDFLTDGNLEAEPYHLALEAARAMVREARQAFVDFYSSYPGVVRLADLQRFVTAAAPGYAPLCTGIPTCAQLLESGSMDSILSVEAKDQQRRLVDRWRAYNRAHIEFVRQRLERQYGTSFRPKVAGMQNVPADVKLAVEQHLVGFIRSLSADSGDYTTDPAGAGRVAVIETIVDGNEYARTYVRYLNLRLDYPLP